MAVLVIALSAVFTTGAETASAATFTRLYSTIEGLALRSGPSSGYTLLQRVNKNTPLDVSCAVIGQNIGGNSVWLHLTEGQWATDYCSTSNGWATRLPTGDPYCDGWAASRGVTRSTNAGVSGQCTWYGYERFRQATGVYPNLSGNAKGLGEQCLAERLGRHDPASCPEPGGVPARCSGR